MKLCDVVECGVRASFGPAGGSAKDAMYCAVHGKPLGLVDVASKRCAHENCHVRPSFGPDGGSAKDATCCKEHAPRDFVDVVHKRCEHEGCGKIPVFGARDSKVAMYCKAHAPRDFVDVKNKRCEHEGCDKIPAFGARDSKVAMYCKAHAPRDFVDVKNKRCEHEGCDKVPCFGARDSKVAMYCKAHAPRDFVDTVSKRCKRDGCDKRPKFGARGSKVAMYCKAHAPRDFVDVVHKRCEHEGCDTIVVDSHRRHCLRCSMHLFPDQPMMRRWKVKEQHVIDAVRDALSSAGVEFPLVQDKRVDGGCSARRPDALIDCLTHSVIVEVDENGHDTYDCSCEDKRIMQLFVDLGSRPLVVLRINPDAYTDAAGVRHGSCFRYHKRLDVPLIFEDRWRVRDRVLRRQVLEHVRSIPTRDLEIRHLFFDGFA